MIRHQTVIAFIVAAFAAASTGADESAQCKQTCGIGKGKQSHVQYPFGFSEGCRIPLNCSATGDIIIDGFAVQNLAADAILINLPAKCNRGIGEIEPLFGRNYAPNWKNGLLLQNCSSALGGCAFPTTMVEKRFGLDRCGSASGSGNISCFSAADRGLNFMTYQDLKQTGCQSLLASVATETRNSTDNNSEVSLRFHVAELEWWLEGKCNCSPNASCIQVPTLIGASRFRCRCNEGFKGDGFADGHGCQRVRDCSALKYISGQCGGRAKIPVLIAGITAGALLVAALALTCYFIRRRRSSSVRNQRNAMRLACEVAGGSSVPFYPYKEIERATNSFSDNQRLGNGAYGTVYAGKLHNDEWVAIKKIRHQDNDGVEKVMNEIKLLSSVSHPNLVQLLGCCIENGEQILVYEYMPNGTLSQHLQRERGTILPWTTRLTIATETARAIAYLHSAMNPPIYHRDIKSSNILLDSNFNSKVADFGLSRLGMTDDSHISTAPQGTPGYVDPQYHQNFHLSDKSDVYSFGVVLVEIITALKVVDFSRPHSEVNLAALAIERIRNGRVDEMIDPFLDPHRDAWTLSSVHKVAELAFRCLAFHRDMRPSMMEVAAELEQIRISGWAPLEENLFIASTCSSPYNGSEKSVGGMSAKKAAGVGSRRLIVPHRAVDRLLSSLEKVKDSSPVSVQDPWLSEQSSPSTNSLLGNVVQ